MRVSIAFVREEQNSVERVKNTVQIGKPMSVMEVVGKETRQGALKKTAVVGIAALTTAAISVPTLTAPASAQSREEILQIAYKLRDSNINMLIGPNVDGYTIQTDPPLNTSLHFQRTTTTYWYAFIAGPGKIGVDILKRPNNYSTARVSYYGKDFRCNDFLGGSYNDRGECYLSQRQPVVIGIAFNHDRGEPRPFKFRVRGYSGIIQQQDIEHLAVIKKEANARSTAGFGGVDLTPKPRFCSRANGRCWY